MLDTVGLLKSFSELDNDGSPFSYELPILEFDDEWLASFEYFEGNKRGHRRIRRYFELDLEYEQPRMEVMAEMIRVFPIFSAFDTDFLIKNVNIDRKREAQSKPEN